MPTAPDGVLSAIFDPVKNLVALVTDGPSWPSPVEEVTLRRSSAGSSSIMVRGADRTLAPGGVLLTSDNEAPLDVDVTYSADGFSSWGALVATSTVTVATTGAAWGLWVKVPGHPELTTRAEVNLAPEQSRETLGGWWDIPGGPTLSQSGSGALAQSAGMGSLKIPDLELTTYSPAELTALHRAVRQAPGQTVLLQSGQPEEIPSGYYFVQSMSTTNPSGLRSDMNASAAPLRRTRLSLVEAAIPAGPASGWTGVTYQDIFDTFPTYQAIVDANLTYLDLATGNF